MTAIPSVQILLAEPDSIHRAHLENIVAHSRYDVAHVAEDRDELFQGYRDRTPDLVLLDVEMAGDDVVPTLKKGFPEARILLSYEPKSAGRVLPNLARGAVDAVKKPFQSAEVFEAFLHACRIPRSRFAASLRSSGRVRVDLKVEFNASRDGFFARRVPGKVSDLSIDGICLRSERDLAIGDNIRVSLVLPGGEGEIRAKAQVVNVRPVQGDLKEYGVAFLGRSKRLRGRIEAFLLEYLSGMKP
ncbi:MAG: PilZ domain-containing protein [Planctomycetes bacterium]|nr:PilZ domain-containing protein [Planctomycetota bacterium]